jgi:hypothetical protein
MELTNLYRALGNAERERDGLKQLVERLTSDNAAMAGQLAEAHGNVQTLSTVIAETAQELRCDADNEVILQAIDDMRSERDALKAEVDRLTAQNETLRHEHVGIKVLKDMGLDHADGVQKTVCHLIAENDSLRALCKEMAGALERLWRYGQIHMVEGVIYPGGSHSDVLNYARSTLSRAKEQGIEP